MDIQEITRAVEQESVVVRQVMANMEKVIVGQRYLIERMIIGLLCDGHLLLEGLPGLAKTTAVKALATTVQTTFQRIQFTPDLLPADILGTQFYRPDTATFEIKKGPIFHNIILADEINRAPAKVQSALLESMQERQVTISDTTYPLPKPFLVMATQNPIEQEGTYPLPEAQVDRFMLKLLIDYPSREEEMQVMERMVPNDDIPVKAVMNPKDILEIRKTVKDIHVETKIKDYILDLVFATREPEKFKNLKELSDLIDYGASPRASIYLAQAAKAHAFLEHRGYVTPDDIKAIGKDILRHRIILTYEAEAEQITQEDIVNRLFDEIEVP